MLRAEDIAVAVHYALTQPARCVVMSMQIGELHRDKD
jgi:NADP-dependent 3-hydroxy acid dehydrogenase YdfG